MTTRSNAETIRSAINTILHTPGWNKPCNPTCLRCRTIAALEEMEWDGQRLRAALGRIYTKAQMAMPNAGMWQCPWCLAPAEGKMPDNAACECACNPNCGCACHRRAATSAAACECPTRAALERLKGAGDRRLMPGSVMLSAPFLDSVIASLDAPCPCAGMRQGLGEPRMKEPPEVVIDAALLGAAFVLRTADGSNNQPLQRVYDGLIMLPRLVAERDSLRAGLAGFGLKTIALANGVIRALLHTADSMAWSFAARRSGRNANDYREAEAFRDAVGKRAEYQSHFIEDLV